MNEIMNVLDQRCAEVKEKAIMTFKMTLIERLEEMKADSYEDYQSIDYIPVKAGYINKAIAFAEAILLVEEIAEQIKGDLK